MADRYESVREILLSLGRRQIQTSRKEVEAGLEYLGLRLPLGPKDLDELASYLGSENKVNQRLIRTDRILSGSGWADAVLAVRRELGLPSTGLSEDQARELHKSLLDNLLRDQLKFVRNKKGELKSVALFWQELITESRPLCTQLSIDPRLLDNLRESYANRSASTLLGVSKLLNPEDVFVYSKREMRFQPTQTDHLIGHVLWNLPLDPRIMEPKPSVSYEWVRLEDGTGRLIQHVFNHQEAKASERRELRTKLQDIKRLFEDGLLLSVSKGRQWHGLSWVQRWQKWNRLFPDFSRPTPGALRKACEYAENHMEANQSRFERLTEMPEPRS